jgi:hypothetical protein
MLRDWLFSQRLQTSCFWMNFMSGLDIAVTIDFLLHDISGFMRQLRTKIPLFDSAKTIVLTDVKYIN